MRLGWMRTKRGNTEVAFIRSPKGSILWIWQGDGVLNMGAFIATDIPTASGRSIVGSYNRLFQNVVFFPLLLLLFSYFFFLSKKTIDRASITFSSNGTFRCVVVVLRGGKPVRWRASWCLLGP